MTELYIPEYPPILESEEGRRMAEYVYRQFSSIRDEFDATAIQYGDGGLITRVATTMPNIAAGNWETVPFDTGQSPTPIKITQDPANNRFSIDEVGEWLLTFYITYTCKKDASQDRYLNWRFYDETAGAPFSNDPFPIFTEAGSNFGHTCAATIAQIDDTLVKHWFRAELGGAARAFNNIELEKAGIVVTRVQTP